MRIHLIIHGGRRDSIPRLREIISDLRKNGHEVSPRILFERGDAFRYAQEGVEEGVELILAAGGDGTIHEVVNAIQRHPRKKRKSDAPLPRVGIIPLGTGNDLAGSLEIPPDPVEAVRVAVGGVRVKVDVGRVNDDYFLNVSTGGFGAEATEESSPEVKRALGTLAYLISSARKFASLEPLEASFRADETLYEGRFLFFAVGNSRRTGGGNWVTPKASMTDGLLDVCLIRDVPKVELLRLMPELRAGNHLDHPAVGYWQVPRLSVKAEAELAVNADGEPLRGSAFDYRLSERRLTLMVPSE